MRKKKNSNILMFACSTVLYKYMKSLINDILNLSDNTHVQIEIYREFITSSFIKPKKDIRI